MQSSVLAGPSVRQSWHWKLACHSGPGLSRVLYPEVPAEFQLMSVSERDAQSFLVTVKVLGEPGLGVTVCIYVCTGRIQRGTLHLPV